MILPEGVAQEIIVIDLIAATWVERVLRTLIKELYSAPVVRYKVTCR